MAVREDTMTTLTGGAEVAQGATLATRGSTMRLESHIDFSTLSWVRPQIDQLLAEARQALETFAESPTDTVSMGSCSQLLHQVLGTLRMVELHGAIELAAAMEQLARGLQDGQAPERDAALAALMRALVQLPDYLDLIESGHKDIPIVLLPLLNELRDARGAAPVDELILFHPEIDVALPPDAGGARAPFPFADLRQRAIRIRSRFQVQLLTWTQGRQPDLGEMGACMDELRALCHAEPARRLWWVAAGVLDALQQGRLDYHVANLRQLFGHLDRIIHRMLDQGEEVCADEDARSLVFALLYQIAQAVPCPGRVDRIAEVFGLAAMVPSAAEMERARAAMSGRNRALLETVARAVREDLLRVKEGLDIFLRREDRQPQQLLAQVETLQRISDTLAMLGLTGPAQLVAAQRRAVTDMVDGQHAADPDAVLEIASVLLQVDASLDEQSETLGSVVASDAALPATEARKITRALMREAGVNLGKVKGAVTGFVESAWSHDQLVDVPQWLDEVTGALHVLELERPAQLIGGINCYVGNELLLDRKIPDIDAMDALADALASIEYYLEVGRDAGVSDDHVLDAAERGLEFLRYWPVPERRRVASVAQVPTALQSVARATVPTRIATGAPAPAPASGPEPVPPLTVDAVLAAAAREPGVGPGKWVDVEEEVLEPIAGDGEPVDMTFHDAAGIDEEIREVFVEEVGEEIANINVNLPAWKAESTNLDALKDVRRSFHTLKGSGRLVGALALGEFSWKIENMLNRVLDQTIQPGADVQAVVDAAVATLPKLHAALQGEATTLDPPLDVIMQTADKLAAGGAAEIADFMRGYRKVTRTVRRWVPQHTAEPTAAADDVTRLTPVAAITSPVSGLPVVDPILLEVLRAEVAQHLAVLRTYLARDAAYDATVDDEVLRAVHTLHGAVSMVGIEVLVEVLAPMEAWVRRARSADAALGHAGCDAVRDAVAITEHVMAQFDAPVPDLPDTTVLAERLAVLRDAWPEAAPLGVQQSSAWNAVTDDAGDGADAASVAGAAAPIPDADLPTKVPEAVEESVQQVRLAAANAEAERLAAERAEAERTANEQAERDRIAAEQAEAERVASEQAEQVEAERVAIEQAEQNRVAAEQAEAERAASEQAEQVEAERVASEQAEQNRVAAEQAEAERAASEQAEAERVAIEQAERNRVATEQAETERAASEQAEAERVAIEQAERNRVATEQAEAERVAAEQAEQDRIAAEQAEAERVAIEQAAQARFAAEQAEAERVAAEAEAERLASARIEAAKEVAAAALPAFPEDPQPDGELAAEGLDAELIELFTEEATELLDASDGAMATLRDAPGDLDSVRGLQRNLHTLKGGARVVGIPQVGELAHAMETLLEKIGGLARPLAPVEVDSLERGFDRLSDLVHRVEAGRAVTAPLHAVERFNALAAGKPIAELLPPPDGQATPAPAPDYVATSIPAVSAVAPPGAAPAPQPTVVTRRVQAEAHAQAELTRVRSDLLDSLVNAAGEASIYRARLEQQVGGFRFNLVELEQTVARLREQLRKLEIETETQILSRYQRESEAGEGAAFDPLELDRFSNLQQYSRALAESVSDLVSIEGILDDQARQAETLLLQQSRVNSDLQDGLMRTRMVPFESLVPNLRRTLRAAADELGKRAQLKVVGAQGEMDRSVLERMKAPFEHMLRNALTHGIEDPTERVAHGKPMAGTVTVTVGRQGTEVLVRVADDGAGFDREAIRAKAIQRGLLQADTPIADAELYNFVLQTGFSTAAAVSQLAGRGIGMDVVANEIRQLGGTLTIESERGRGTTFDVRLPFTLAVTQAITVRVHETAFAIPMTSIAAVSRIPRQVMLERLALEQPTIMHAGEKYALHDLSELLGLGRGELPEGGTGQLPLLLVHTGDVRAAIRVDSVIGAREIVVKPVAQQVGNVPGMFGATIMGDGSVMLILDLAPLVRHFVARHAAALAQTASSAEPVVPATAAPSAEGAPRLVMVVDDSITMRKVTTRVLERERMEVITAKDGVEALEKLPDRVPDVMLLDVEMPRMDGYELATRMKNDTRFRAVPIIMITSRTGEKHRERAFEIGVDRYLGKPYSEADLLRNIRELLETQHA